MRENRKQRRARMARLKREPEAWSVLPPEDLAFVRSVVERSRATAIRLGFSCPYEGPIRVDEEQ